MCVTFVDEHNAFYSLQQKEKEIAIEIFKASKAEIIDNNIK